MKILRHYTGVMQHWLRIILIGTVICSITTLGINAFVIKPIYQASSLIKVTSNNDIFHDQALAIGYALLVTSTDVLREVAHKVPGTDLSQLQSLVSASPQAGSEIIEVRAQANSPQQAAAIANTVVSVFIQLQVEKALAPLTDQDTKISQNLLTTKAAMDQIQRRLTDLQKSGASTDAIAAENNILATYQANYNTLQTSQSQVQIQESQAKNTLTVFQTAIPPGQMSSPHILLNTIIAAALGLLLMIVLALLLDWLDVSIQTPEDVTNLAQLEPLESVPLTTHPLLLANEANPSETSDEKIEQAFTIMAIRTNLSIQNKGQHLVLVTGLRTAAGVTTTASNLAIVLAHLGRRVLLVDANLHQPSLHEIFHCSDTSGLVNSLDQLQSEIGPSWLNSWRTNIPNLWLLPVSSATAYTPIVQHLPEMRVLTEHLLGKTQGIPDTASSGAVDIIIFDAPALGKGVDTIALASLTDCSLLVVEAGKEHNEMVSKAGDVLQRLGSPVLGVVVNRQTTRHRPYFYTGEHSQKTALAGNLSLEGAIEALLTKPTVLPDTPLSLPQANRQNGLPRQPQPPANGSIHNATEPIPPSPYIPWSQDQQGVTNSEIPALKLYSSEDPQ